MFVCSLLQSKALRERWLLDGAPAEEETQKRLQEDEVKTKLLEQVIFRSANPPPCALTHSMTCEKVHSHAPQPQPLPIERRDIRQKLLRPRWPREDSYTLRCVIHSDPSRQN